MNDDTTCSRKQLSVSLIEQQQQGFAIRRNQGRKEFRIANNTIRSFACLVRPTIAQLHVSIGHGRIWTNEMVEYLYFFDK